MKIGAFLGFSLIDFPGRPAAVVFTRGCNFLCPSCHAKYLLDGDAHNVPEEEIFRYLSANRDWIDGVTVCGGEPTVQPDLIDFLKRLRGTGCGIKIDTNGSRPEVLKEILDGKLADYAAMDIKAPESLMRGVTGGRADTAKLRESMLLVREFAEHEFRTTIVPVRRPDGGLSFLKEEEIGAAAAFIKDVTGTAEHVYYIQKFVPRKNGLLDPEWEKCPETPIRLLEKLRDAAAVYLPDTRIRG